MALAKPIRVREAKDSLRALIVEDRDSVAAELRDRLDSLGLDVAGVVPTPAAAIRAVRNKDVDLVVVNVGRSDASARFDAENAGEEILRGIEQDRLQAQKTESLGRLASGVAHDFNNLLVVINGCTEIALQSEELSPATRALLNDVVLAGSRAAGLTKQFLNFARKAQPEPRILDLNSMVRLSGNLLRRLLRADIEFVESLAPGPLAILAAETHVDQIVMNLVLNARDAMSDGGTITIETGHVQVSQDQAEAEAGEYAVLVVSDTGHGIADSIKPHIFDPWFTTKDGKGTGVGLANIYGIVREYSGFITVESEPSRGTTFRIHLPLAQTEPNEDSAEAQPAGTLPQPRESYSLLVVEDEPMVRSLIVDILRSEGYKVAEAAGPEEAAAIFAQHPGHFDLMITDIMMPGIKGPALANLFRQEQPGLRVLYVTGYSDELTLEPGDGFIQKPFAPDTLATTVRDSLSGRRTAV